MKWKLCLIFKSVKFVPKQSDSKVRHHDDLKKKKKLHMSHKPQSSHTF